MCLFEHAHVLLGKMRSLYKLCDHILKLYIKKLYRCVYVSSSFKEYVGLPSSLQRFEEIMLSKLSIDFENVIMLSLPI
jgi:hypothetical protein